MTKFRNTSCLAFQRVSGALQNHVGSARLPADCKSGGWRRLRFITARSAGFGPLLEGLKFGVAKSSIADKRGVVARREPRGHESLLGHVDDLAGATANVVVGQQAERRSFAGMMTRGAFLKDNRRDVVSKGDGVGIRSLLDWRCW